MAYKTLCWKCKNCCSVNDCEFVYKIDKYYRNTSNIIDENGNVKLIRDLTKYYIPGTKTDTQGNILYCPKFEEDGLNHKSEHQQELNSYCRKSSQLRECKKLLDDYSELMSKMSQEEKEARQKAFYQKVLEKQIQKEKEKKNKNYYIQKQTKKNGSVYFYYRDKKTRKHIKLKDIGGCENDLSKC